MNGKKYLLDTCFVIRWHGLEADALAILQKHDLRFEQCYYSAITYAELFS